VEDTQEQHETSTPMQNCSLELQHDGKHSEEECASILIFFVAENNCALPCSNRDPICTGWWKEQEEERSTVRPWHSCPERSCGSSIPGGTQGQVGWGPGQPELLNGSPAHSMGLRLGGLRDSFQPKPFCDSMSFSSM